MNMKNLEELKNTPNLLIQATARDGGCGSIFLGRKPYASVIWSNGGGWEHVSISPYKSKETPSWDMMCLLKDMFFYEYETVVQYHPKKSEKVNIMSNCLHLWRPIKEKLPIPPKNFV